jgi:hypothetical protein
MLLSRIARAQRLLFNTALAALLIMTGCGGSSSNSPSAPVIPPLSITTASLPNAALNAAYSATVQATGGTSPYTFALHSGSLPTGLSLLASGSISGSATAAGTYTVSIQATDSSATPLTAYASYTLSIYNATVQVTPTTALAVVPQTGFGIHTSVYDAGLSDVTLLPALLATSGITTLRYPGGDYSDNYHWAQYSLTPEFASTAPACGTVQNGYLAPKADFGNFIKTLQATSTQAVITVNYGSSLGNATGSSTAGSYGPNTCSQPFTSGQPQEAAAWVAYANGSTTNTQTIGLDAVGFNWQTVGFWASLRAATPLSVDDGYNFLRIGQSAPIGIKYWEIGNEIFYNGFSNNQNYETDLHAPYVYPNGYSGSFNSRNGISALSPSSYGTNSVQFIQAMRAVDSTIKIGLDLSSPNVDPIASSWNPAAITAVCAGATFDFGIFHYYPGTFNAVTAAQLLSLPQTNIPALLSTAKSQINTSCSGGASNVQFFITETGANGSYATGVPAVINGLYATNVYLQALSDGVANIDWLELHNGTFLTQGTEAADPAFYGIELAHLLAGVGDTLVSSSSSSSSVVSYASLKLNGQNGVVLINADPVNAVTVQVTVAGGGLSGSATQYSYGLSTTQSAAALAPTSFTVTGNSYAVTIPAYTATTVLVP